jgi:hypothetical protein
LVRWEGKSSERRAPGLKLGPKCLRSERDAGWRSTSRHAVGPHDAGLVERLRLGRLHGLG